MVDLSDYIAQLENLRMRKTTTLTEGELREIVRELGWTEEDMVHLDNVVQTHVEKGSNFLERRLVDEAIDEFHHAHLLAPHRPLVMLRLAQSHALKWQTTKESDNRKTAEELALRVIDASPDNKQAYDVLAAVRIPPYQKNARMVMIAVAMAFVLLFVAGGVAFVITAAPEPAYEQPATSHPPAFETHINPPVENEAPMPMTGDVTIPATLSVAGNHALRLETRRSINKNFPDSSFFEYGWLLHNESDHEFKSIKGQLELLDSSGKAVVTTSVEVLGTHEALLRRNDVHTFSSTLRSNNTVVSARLNLTTVDARPAPKSYPVPTVIPLTWDVTKPSTAGLIVKERESQADKGSEPLRFFKGTWEIHNSGDHPFDLLKLEIDFLDDQGKVFDSHQKYICVRSGADFRAGEVRTFSTTRNLKGNFASYRIRVVEIL